MTPNAKLLVVEKLIEDFRWTREDLHAPERAVYTALKEIASDIRGRMPDARTEAIEKLERRIDGAKRAGYPSGHLIGVGQELISHWPTVRLALEQFRDQPPVNRDERVQQGLCG